MATKWINIVNKALPGQVGRISEKALPAFAKKGWTKQPETKDNK